MGTDRNRKSVQGRYIVIGNGGELCTAVGNDGQRYELIGNGRC